MLCSSGKTFVLHQIIIMITVWLGCKLDTNPGNTYYAQQVSAYGCLYCHYSHMFPFSKFEFFDFYFYFSIIIFTFDISIEYYLQHHEYPKWEIAQQEMCKQGKVNAVRGRKKCYFLIFICIFNRIYTHIHTFMCHVCVH